MTFKGEVAPMLDLWPKGEAAKAKKVALKLLRAMHLQIVELELLNGAWRKRAEEAIERVGQLKEQNAEVQGRLDRANEKITGRKQFWPCRLCGSMDHRERDCPSKE